MQFFQFCLLYVQLYLFYVLSYVFIFIQYTDFFNIILTLFGSVSNQRLEMFYSAKLFICNSSNFTYYTSNCIYYTSNCIILSIYFYSIHGFFGYRITVLTFFRFPTNDLRYSILRNYLYAILPILFIIHPIVFITLVILPIHFYSVYGFFGYRVTVLTLFRSVSN